jgi:hypothetical protein
MCYTEKSVATVLDSGDVTGTYGQAGYHTDCRNIAFTEVLYVNHDDNDQQAWFVSTTGTGVTLSNTGYTYTYQSGLWEGYGRASMHESDPWNNYQVQFCGSPNFLETGIMTSGYWNNCWKVCDDWCSDVTSPYYRTSSGHPAYDGVAFGVNGHEPLSDFEVGMSVGIRNRAAAAPSCKDILEANPGASSGVYTLSPKQDGNTFDAYCDMDTDGGGWTMCYTVGGDNEWVYIQNGDVTGSYGSGGYRTDCRDIPFTGVQYRVGDEFETFEAASGVHYYDSGSYGAHGPKDSTYWHRPNDGTNYQLLVCTDGWMETGFFMSGYTSCWKQCNDWCSDASSWYFRVDGDDGGSYNGVSFRENGHKTVTSKSMSVGIR